MSMYRITWTIDIEAMTAEGAAIKALAIQRDTQSSAVVFDVQAINGDGWPNALGAARTVDLNEISIEKFAEDDDD